MKVSDYIIKFLEEIGTEYIFGYIGGDIIDLVDSVYKNKRIRFIQVYHEQTAAIAAEGYSRNSDKMGVAISSSGAGATNMITGIADAYFDSIPTIFITGRAEAFEIKHDKPIKQQGFHKIDIVSMVKPITKYCEKVDKAENIRYYLEKAVYFAKEGRPGPVLLDIPVNIQKSNIRDDNLKGYDIITQNEQEEDFEWDKLKEEIRLSKKPVILAGGGIIKGDAIKELEEFSIRNRIPVVTSLMGKGSYDEESEYFVGMIGYYGNRCANMFLANSDLVLALGTRLNTRQTGTNLNSFVRKGKIIHVDRDNNELIFHRLENRIKVNCDIKKFFTEMADLKVESNNPEWFEYLKMIKEKFSQQKEIEASEGNKIPYRFLEKLNQISKKDDIFAVDIGQNQMFAAQTLIVKDREKFFTSGGIAPMGYALPVAIGASFANKSSRIFSIMGDGAFHISLQSLMLISQYNLPIFVFVINNSSLGMITRFQELYFDDRKYATTKEFGYCVPDIKKIAKAYDLNYINIDESDITSNKMEKFISENKNGLIEIVVNGKTKLVPELENGSPIEDTSPKLSIKELRENMLIELI